MKIIKCGVESITALVLFMTFLGVMVLVRDLIGTEMNMFKVVVWVIFILVASIKLSFTDLFK